MTWNRTTRAWQSGNKGERGGALFFRGEIVKNNRGERKDKK